MLKKLAIIGIIILLIIPFQSVIGKNQIFSTKNNNQTSCQIFDSDVITMINKINYSILFDYLEKIVSFGVRHVGSENCSKAAEYINEEFQRLGLDSYIDEWEYPKYKCQNIVGTYNGTDPDSDAVFVLTAHLDTIGNSVGANDDGSGVATLLTIANITSKYHFNHTIKFVIVSGHEVGIYGKVYNEKTGEPVKGAFVEVSLWNVYYWGIDFTDSNGEYYIKSSRQCGELWITARKFGYGGWLFTPATLITVEPGDVVELDLYLKPWFNNVHSTQTTQSSSQSSSSSSSSSSQPANI